MDIGRLNRTIKVLRAIRERDEFGGEDITWWVVKEKWAKIEPISGTEVFTSSQITAETAVKITTRYDKDITVLDRIGYEDKVYEIIGVIDSKTSHRTTIINCKETVNDGLYSKTKEG